MVHNYLTSGDSDLWNIRNFHIWISDYHKLAKVKSKYKFSRATSIIENDLNRLLINTTPIDGHT